LIDRKALPVVDDPSVMRGLDRWRSSNVGRVFCSSFSWESVPDRFHLWGERRGRPLGRGTDWKWWQISSQALVRPNLGRASLPLAFLPNAM